MNDINAYANEQLLDFMDSAHVALSQTLQKHFGPDWLELGVRKHCGTEYFARAEKMLNSPMRVVEIDKTDDEIYGVEHLWPIIGGNWSTIFKRIFQDRARTESCLGEIKELRHNLSHRRKRHYLLRTNLIRVMGSCRMILAALGSPRADAFSETLDSLSSGGTPWGAPLDGQLPPRDEMYSEFVGRPGELEDLTNWIASDSPQVLVWGYGGVGKSALAYKFARDIRESSSESLMAVCWVSAKKFEFSERETRARAADFSDLESFLKALWRALYGGIDVPEDIDPDTVIKELHEIPILLVVDDFDTISEDVKLTEFLLYSLRGTPTKVIYTSRHRVPALTNLEVPAFDDDELRDFVLQRSLVYRVDQTACLHRLNSIKSVTGGYPLFVDDLVHHAAFYGIDQALGDWGQRKGDAARQYALQRQIEFLSSSSSSSGDVLIALSASNRGLKIVEISAIAGLTDDDTEAGVRELLKWRMVHEVAGNDSETPSFRMNKNTSRLVQQTFRGDGRMTTFVAAFRALTGERVPEAKRATIARIVARTKSHVRRGDFQSAEDHLVDDMTGELTDSADLVGVLGWLYSLQPIEQFAASAQDAFRQSHRLGSTKIDTYFHWGALERKIAENMIATKFDTSLTDDAIAAQWKQSEDVVAMGIGRCGPSQILCYWAGYAAAREAKAKERARSFVYAEAAYRRSKDWYLKALTAPVSDDFGIPVGAIYRACRWHTKGLRNLRI